MIWKFFEQLIYRQDLSLNFQNMVYSKTFSERAHNKALQEGGRSTPARVLPESLEHLLLLNSSDHMKAVAADHSFLTLHARSDGQIQLETRTMEAGFFSEGTSFLSDAAYLEAIADMDVDASQMRVSAALGCSSPGTACPTSSG